MEVKKILGNWLDANTFVIKKSKEAIIIDCGAKPEKVKEETKDLKVVGILLTHGHFDHTAFALEYAKDFNCPIIASAKIQETLIDTKKNYGEGFYIDDFSSFKFLEKENTFQIGNFNIKNYACPGHSPCCESYLIDNLLFAGDTLFSSGIGRLDLLTSNRRDMLQTLEKLKTVKFDMLYSGHGDESTHERQQRNISAYIKFLNR